MAPFSLLPHTCRRYDGQWVEGKRCGQGRCTYSNGDTYRGTWAADKFNGQGMLAISGALAHEEGGGRATCLPTLLLG